MKAAAVAAILIGLAGAAGAQGMGPNDVDRGIEQGIVKSYDPQTWILTLSTGRQYELSRPQEGLALKPGDRVLIRWRDAEATYADDVRVLR